MRSLALVVLLALGMVVLWASSTMAGPTPTSTPTPTATPIPAPLDKDQQKCVNEMNKRGERVNKAQLKENEKCLRDFQKGKLTTSFEECTSADRTGKVQKAEDKTVTGEGKKCGPLAVLPPFGYTDPPTVNGAAKNGAWWMVDDILGEPVQDASIVTKAANKGTYKCQFEMLRQGGRFENTVLKEVRKAKKKALKKGVDSSDALSASVAEVFPGNSKLPKKEAQLKKKVERKCSGITPLPRVLFPGYCGRVPASGTPTPTPTPTATATPTATPTGTLSRKDAVPLAATPTPTPTPTSTPLPPSIYGNVEECVIVAARCRACMTIKVFDGLDLDCDLADDQSVNESCPTPTTWFDCASAGGVEKGEACWFLGAEGESCNDACANDSLFYDDATATYAGDDGSGGTLPNCLDVLALLGADNGANLNNEACAEGLGCFSDTDPVSYGRCFNPATKGPASSPGVKRACACQEQP